MKQLGQQWISICAMPFYEMWYYWENIEEEIEREWEQAKKIEQANNERGV